MRLSLPRTVVVLGLASFLNDTASDMIAPLLPLFLTTTLGAGPAIIGLVEGIAESTSSLLKLVSGRLADRGWNQKAMVLGGYGVSNTARPLIGLALGWPFVLVLRFFDRVGKGLRTSPRDALIAASVDDRRRGAAFGFHRAFDSAGAMLGPLIAFALLSQGIPMEQVFLWSLVPGLLVVTVLVVGLAKTPSRPPAIEPEPLSWRGLDRRLRGLIVAAGGIAMAAVPEAFLVLWASTGGITVADVSLIWAAANGVKALVATPAGMASDRYGRLRVLVVGWGARFGLLVCMGLIDAGPLVIGGLFLAYAGSLAATEGAERALIGDLAAEGQKATAFGVYHMIVGLSALPGALIFGVLWQGWGQSSAFLTAATVGALSTLTLLWLSKRPRPGATA